MKAEDFATFVRRRATVLFAVSLFTLNATQSFAVFSVPASNSIAWSYDMCGVPGGIPNRTNIYTTLTSSATAADINAALSACPSNQVVKLGPGVYNLTATIQLPFRKKGVTLRGSGKSTILQGNNVSYVINWGPGLNQSAGVALTSGGAKGSSNIVVASASSFQPGMLIFIDQANDTSLVYNANSTVAQRDQSQVTHVEAINGNTLTIWPPLYWTMSNNPQVYNWADASFQAEFDGVEDLVVTYAGSTHNGIIFQYGFGCWLKGVTVSNTPNYAITCLDLARCSFQDVEMLLQTDHMANHSGLNFIHCCGCIVEDSIAYQMFPGLEINNGSSGNIFAYNFIWDAFQDNFGQGCAINANHGPHNLMNLYEGNITGTLQSDGYWGSASHCTVFRNYCTGWSPSYTNQNSKAIALNRWSLYWTVVGNVLGYSSATFPGGESAFAWGTDTANSPMPNYFTPVVYVFGYPNSGNNGYTGFRPPNPAVNPGNDQSLDLRVYQTTLLHKNFDFFTKTTANAAGQDTVLPTSMYLTSKPAWMGSLPFPMIGPDVSTNESIAAAATFITNPARERFYGRTNYLSAVVSPPSGLRVIGP
jgi:hypothetical protein